MHSLWYNNLSLPCCLQEKKLPKDKKDISCIIASWAPGMCPAEDSPSM